MRPQDIVAFIGPDASQTPLALPTEEEVDDAIRRHDLVTLLLLDERVRDAWPLDSEVTKDTALQVVTLAKRIRQALAEVQLSDGSYQAPRPPQRPSGGPQHRPGDSTPLERARAAREALERAQKGEIDVEAIARAAAIKARLRP